MKRSTLLIPLFLLAALFFGWKTYEAWTAPPEAVPPPPAGAVALPASAAVSEPAPVPSPELSGLFAAIVVRPLFRPDRRPFQDNAGAVVPLRNYEAELSRFTLLGVLLLGNDRKGVVVGRGTAGREERWEVGPGDVLPGFTVKEIGADGVTLTADNKEFLLPLYAGGPKGQAGQAPIRTDVAPPRPAAAPAPQVPARPPAVSAPQVPARPPTVSPQTAPTGQPSAVQPAPSGPASLPPGIRSDFGRDRTRPTFMPRRR